MMMERCGVTVLMVLPPDHDIDPGPYHGPEQHRPDAVQDHRFSEQMQACGVANATGD
jgi:hypothetical protein